MPPASSTTPPPARPPDAWRWERGRRQDTTCRAVGAAHGTDLLGGAGGARLQATLIDFLRSHGGPATTTSAQGGGSAVADRCGPPDAAASLVHFRAADGTRLDGALVGSGRAGVVLLH